MIVHIAEKSALEEIVEELPEETKALTDRFWPGPLTLILKKNARVPYGTTGGLDTVAVRMPDDPIALELIRRGGGYVSAPSANHRGRPSPTTAQHVAEDLDGKIDMILDGGNVNIGVESTIVDMTSTPPMILRPGAVTKEMLEEVIGEVETDRTLLSENSPQAPKAPGMKYRHYAPKAQMILIEGPRLIQYLRSNSSHMIRQCSDGREMANHTGLESCYGGDNEPVHLWDSEEYRKPGESEDNYEKSVWNPPGV